MALFNRNRFRALASAFMLSTVLTGCGGGGGAAPNPTFTSGTQNQAQITNLLSAGGGNDAVDIAGDTVSDIDSDMAGVQPGLAFEGFLDGLGGDDEVRLVGGGRVASIAFSAEAPTSGELHLQNYEIITITGGTVDGTIDASGATTAITFDLRSGRVGPTTGTTGGTIAITGSGQNDVFIISGDLTGDSPTLDINGRINGAVGTDEVQFNTGAVVNNVSFSQFVEGGGGVHLQDVETITIDGGEILNLLRTDVATTGITFNLRSGTINSDGSVGGGIAGSNQDDIFNLRGTITINGLINGNDGADIFNLEGGTITGDVLGGGGIDRFIIGAGITIGGMIDGGADADTLSLATGFTPTAANLFGGVLTLTLNGGGSLALTLANIATENINVGTLTLTTMMLPAPGGGDPMTPTTLTFTGTAEADTFAITTDLTGSSLTPLESVIDGLTGDDTLQLNTGAVVASIAFANTPPTGGVVNLQSVEIITINGGRVTGNITGPATATTFNLMSGTVGGNVVGGAEVDTFTLSGGSVTGNIDGGGGNDMFTWSGGTVGGYIDGGADADTFTATAAVNVRVTTAADTTANAIRLRNVQTITLSGGDDTLVLLEGTVGGNINMGGGNDELTVTGGVTFGASSTIDGGAGDMDRFVWGTGLTTNTVSVSVDSGNNQIFLGAIQAGNTASAPINFEVFVLDGGTVGTYTGNNSNNIFELRSGTVTGGIGGIAGNNRFTLLSGMVGANITGGTGVDTFMLTGGMVTGNVLGSTGNDAFTWSGGTVGGYIDGGDDTDTFTATAAVDVRVTTDDTDTGGDIRLRNVETIILSGANDTLNLLSGSVGDINTGGGNDQVTVTGGVTFGSTTITGGAGDMDRFVWGDGLTTSGVTNGVGPTFTLAGSNPGTDETHDGTNTVPNPFSFEVFVLDGGTIGSYTGFAFVDTLELLSGSVTGEISTGNGNDTITISGGNVTGDINGGPNNDTITLSGGTVTGSVNGGTGSDNFILGGTTFATSSVIDGGVGDTDVLQYAGAGVAVGNNFTPAAGTFGLAVDTDIANTGGSVRNFAFQREPPTQNSVGAGLRGAFGFEVLGLSPALNLYGAMSDALMQFGQQTAQGFALADLNLATGRGTQLVSKNSPFTKGRIWAHKITHSGNGKGSIGLNLTGLTARADSDYDYEMSLTQHGFDAPLAATKLGAFNLRAVSHTMTGTIETNVAEAQVSGYGAGVALMWRGGAAASKASASVTRVSAHHHGLSAHITSLAGAYEVEAHTSPLNPRAVVSEITEGSFSAINAVVSAGVADTRKLGHSLVLRTTADLVWQTLSLDDFTETGSGGIAINFDKATRFTARVGAGLEGEHWFSDVAFVHETSSGGTLSSGLRQDYKQDDGTAIEMKFGGKLADLATGLTLKAYAGLRTSLITSDSIDPSAHLALIWRF